MSYYRQCPRCGDRTLEHLETYSHCCQCLYFEDYWVDSESEYYDALDQIEKLNSGIVSDEIPHVEDPVEPEPLQEGA